mgnify:CR=1 FL=1
MDRRVFLGASAGAMLGAQQGGEWGSPVIDIHLHPRKTVGDCFVHMEGCGAQKAVLLTRLADADKAKGEIAMHPGRFIWFVAADPAQPGNFEGLQKALDSGARGIGEMKNHTTADAKEMRKVYDMCAERKVPVLIHFQEVDHFENEGKWSTGFAKSFESMLKAFPKTKFIGHADAFWANVSADYHNEAAYPSGPIKPGGISDKLLSDYANFYGDCSANSGNNALSRDAEFTKGFLARHQDKLMFGSDCSCSDGHGAGISQANNPAAARLNGKCVARATLTILKASTTPAVFKKITWDNAHKLLKIPA